MQTTTITPTTPRPKVAYVLKRYPRYSETFIVNEILAHEAAGLDICIYGLRTPTDSHFQPAIADVRAPVHYLRRGGVSASLLWEEVRRTAKTYDSVWQHLGAAAACDGDEVYQALLLAQQIPRQGITHVHAHFGTSAASVARMASLITGVPYTFTAHAKDIFHEYVDLDALAEKVADAAAVVTVSDFNVNYLSQLFPTYAHRFQRIYNGIDLTEFAYQSPSSHNPPQPVILAVGRMVEKKGFRDLVDACVVLRQRAGGSVNFECQIIGGGELQQTLQDYVHQRGVHDQVTLLGPQPLSRVRAAMRSAAMLVAPCITASTNDQDGLPTVILEAMALGTPIVATDVTGIPEAVVDQQNGHIVPQQEPVELASAIDRLLANPAERSAMSQAGRARAEALFDIHKNSKILRELFARCGQRRLSQPLQEAG